MTSAMEPEVMRSATETASAATVTRPLDDARVRFRWAMKPGTPKRRPVRPERAGTRAGRAVRVTPVPRDAVPDAPDG